MTDDFEDVNRDLEARISGLASERPELNLTCERVSATLGISEGTARTILNLMVEKGKLPKGRVLLTAHISPSDQYANEIKDYYL